MIILLNLIMIIKMEMIIFQLIQENKIMLIGIIILEMNGHSLLEVGVGVEVEAETKEAEVEVLATIIMECIEIIM